MRIQELKVSNLRVLEEMRLAPAQQINIVCGPNGAGKTSILEAIYLAGRGRTFRHSEARPVIRSGADEALVVVRLEQADAMGKIVHSTLGVARSAKALRCRLNGEDIKKRSRLAETLPVQWIGSQPQSLLEMGPEVRRRFLDMAVFHVEHAYLNELASYQRALRQRNAAIRTRDAKAVQAWDEATGVAGEAVTLRRQTVLTDLIDRLKQQLQAWDLGFAVDCHYRKGWSDDRPLIVELASRTARDIDQGFTAKGPHRAELVFSTEGHRERERVEKSLSRGQLKLFVVALNLAMMDVMSAANPNRRPVLLLDDLAAELDYQNREKVLAAVQARACQAFLTRLTDDRLPEIADQKVFHVEHGQLV